MESVSEAVEGKARRGLGRGWISREAPLRKRRTRLVEVVARNLRKYCENSSLVGYRYFIEPERPWTERALWMLLHVSTLCVLAILVRNAYLEYQNVPVVTVVDSDNYPSAELEFPGIAICNINRISQKAAMKLASEIVTANITDRTFLEVLQLVKRLGDLYEDAEDLDVRQELDLNDILKKLYSDDYDVTMIMKNLSPSCEDALSACHFHGELRNCSDIFTFRKTQHGFCCTFNYARETDDIPNFDDIKKKKPRQPYNISSLGITNGLSLVMEPFVEDYYYPILPIIGWKVTVFNARDYPDNDSGSVSEALLSPGTETFVDLDVTSFYSSNKIRSVASEKRKCIFQDELPVLYTGYTYSDCLVDCRAAAIFETCKCRPFYLPRRGNDQYKQRICNTADSECLYKYREVYWTVLSNKVRESEENERMYKLSDETAKRCSSCYPACNDTHYYLHSSTTYIKRGIYRSELVDNILLVNQSIVHIYVTKHGSVRLKQEKAYYWYELLSNIGGICGVFVGFSLISVAEFLYFVFRTLAEYWRGNRGPITRRTTRMRTVPKRIDGRDATEGKRFTGSLYWNEFLSQSGTITKQDRRFQGWRH